MFSFDRVEEKYNEDEEIYEEDDLVESGKISSRVIPPKYWSFWQGATDKLKLRQTKK